MSDERDNNYNENRDKIKFVSADANDRIIPLNKALDEAIKPLRDRIVALEILLDARRLESNEKDTTIGILRREIVELKKNKT